MPLLLRELSVPGGKYNSGKGSRGKTESAGKQEEEEEEEQEEQEKVHILPSGKKSRKGRRHSGIRAARNPLDSLTQQSGLREGEKGGVNTREAEKEVSAVFSFFPIRLRLQRRRRR